MSIRVHSYRYRSTQWSQIVQRAAGAFGVLAVSIALANASATASGGETPFKKPIRDLIEHYQQS